jgi:chromosome segregation ATPase
MPFVTSQAQATRRAGRRKTRQQFQVGQAQSQYKQNILSAQTELQTAQSQAASEFSALSEQYETGLADYRDSLASYDARGEAFSSKIDDYINTINNIERAKAENMQRQLMVVGGLADIFRPSWARFTDLATGHSLNNGVVEFQEDVGGEGS